MLGKETVHDLLGQTHALIIAISRAKLIVTKDQHYDKAVHFKGIQTKLLDIVSQLNALKAGEGE
jgi:hypothetical protein